MGRSLRIRIDARTQSPEDRGTRGEFRHPHIEEYARQNRAALVAALVTLARAAGKLPANAPILGGFEDFSRRMGSILEGIGVNGFLQDRCDLSALSQEESALIHFMEEWAEKYPDGRASTEQLVSIAEEIEGFPLGRSDTPRSKATALAIFLRQKRQHTVGKWRIGDPSKYRPTYWTLHPSTQKSL
jgi:hypothetical protein